MLHIQWDIKLLRIEAGFWFWFRTLSSWWGREAGCTGLSCRRGLPAVRSCHRVEGRSKSSVVGSNVDLAAQPFHLVWRSVASDQASGEREHPRLISHPFIRQICSLVLLPARFSPCLCLESMVQWCWNSGKYLEKLWPHITLALYSHFEHN